MVLLKRILIAIAMVLAIAGIALVHPTAAPLSVTDAAAVTAGTPQPTWNTVDNFPLIFDDEFNSTKLNTSLWNNGWYGSGITGPVNSNETVRYNSANISESGGVLLLPLNNYGTLVNTNGHFSMTYGRVEFHAYLPAGTNGRIADWPGLWLDGQPNWPDNGEIDVIEGLGGTAAYHYHSPAGGPGADVSSIKPGWNTFGMYWAPGVVKYYYNGKFVGQITQDIQGAPMFLVMQHTAGDGGPKAATSPDYMYIDWVRAWALNG